MLRRSHFASTCFERSDEGVSADEAEGFRGWFHSLGRDKELSGISDKVLVAMRMEVEEKGLMLSIMEGGKEEKSKVTASCSCMGEMLQECSRKGGGGERKSARCRFFLPRGIMFVHWCGFVADDGLVFARWRGQAVGISPIDSLELRR